MNTFEPTGIQDAEDKGTPRVTAANASGINDGAAAIVLASGEAVEKYGLKPMVKLIGWGQGGVDPKIMGVGPLWLPALLWLRLACPSRTSTWWRPTRRSLLSPSLWPASCTLT